MIDIKILETVVTYVNDFWVLKFFYTKINDHSYIEFTLLIILSIFIINYNVL